MPSLYVHIPFCLKKCIYCDFVSGIYAPEKADAYIEALKKEIQSIPAQTRFETLYIGGGTPTALSTEHLTDLITHIFANLNLTSPPSPFTKGEYYEATIEANPGTVDREKLSAILSAGINRLSIGVQSFDDSGLACLGRLHTAVAAEHAVILAKQAGFNNIGIDLIYAIPGQGIASWRKTLEKAVSLKPQHISAYELTVEKGTPLYEYLNQTPPFNSHLSKGGHEYMTNPPSPPFVKGGMGGFVDEEEIIEMYNRVIDYLTSEGYCHYEISNFSLPGYECRHNLNYWQRGEYYGAGVGASSFINGKRLRNTAQTDDYIRLVSENKSPVKETEVITAGQALSEAIFLGLRQTGGVLVDSISQRYGKDLLEYYRKEIAESEDAGLIEFNDAHLRLTRKGLILSNEVFKKFM